MEENVEQKKRKGSKNKKKNWRKNADIADVEEHLEDLRREERTGGPISGIQDEHLFFVDKDTEKNNTKKKKRILIIDDDDDEDIYVSKKEKFLQNLKKEKEKERQKIEKRRKAKVVNVWGQGEMAVQDAFLESTVKKAKVKPNTVGVGKLEISAVPAPDPGTSYNPDYDSHQKLLGEAAAEVERQTKEKQKWSSKVKMVSVEELKRQSEIWLKEMSQGLNINDGDKDSDDEEELELLSPPSVNKIKQRKTSQQKRKQKLLKAQDRQRFRAKLSKEKMNDVFRLKSIKKEIRREEDERDQRIKERLQNQQDVEKIRTKRLSKHKFQENGITYQLSEDLAGSLREMKPESNLIKERFKSLQRRNIIEVRRPVVPHRRYKRKVYTRKSYSAPTIKEFDPMRKRGT